MLRAGVVVVHEGAAPRPDRHQPGGLEIAQRLAHRRLARAELARELQLDQPLAGRIVAADDALQQHVADARADRLVIQRVADASSDLTERSKPASPRSATPQRIRGAAASDTQVPMRQTVIQD